MPFDLNRLFLDWNGRISRKDLWIGVVILTVAAIVVMMIFGLVIFAIFGTGFFARLIYFLCALPFIYVSTCLSAKRFQDRDKPGSYAWIGAALSILSGLANVFVVASGGLISVVLGIASFVIGIWFLVELGFLRGTIGPNSYGPDPEAAASTAGV